VKEPPMEEPPIYSQINIDTLETAILTLPFIKIPNISFKSSQIMEGITENYQAK